MQDSMIFGILAAGMLCTGCAYNTFHTVETLPEGKTRMVVGGGLLSTTSKAFYPDEPARPELDQGAYFSVRRGSWEGTEWDFSMDGLWPGVGLKVRAAEYLALKGDLHMTFPVIETSPPLLPYFTGTLIAGTSRVGGGLKFLSSGTIPGSAGRSRMDLGGFAGARIPVYRNLSLAPEVSYFLRHREPAGGLALVFN